ncbi:MAG: hypothetical protein K8L97_17580 [Anaerolineae bacterium]|nr:hypothetical protein [Anaerolineae bacterium]
MPRKKKSKRGFKLIAFKAYHDTDADILDWWEGIEEGERSEMIRDLIRGFLGVQSKRRKTHVINLPELVEVRQDTLWIRDALNDMPAYLERIIQHVAANATVQPVAVGQAQPRASPVETQTHEPALTDAESQRRTRRMKRATW